MELDIKDLFLVLLHLHNNSIPAIVVAIGPIRGTILVVLTKIPLTLNDQRFATFAMIFVSSNSPAQKLD
jgi:hypothetical protein